VSPSKARLLTLASDCRELLLTLDNAATTRSRKRPTRAPYLALRARAYNAPAGRRRVRGGVGVNASLRPPRPHVARVYKTRLEGT
jgi:hypothetical protein